METGRVFIKEIVPKRMISFVANTFYNENYVTHQMKHSWTENENWLHVAYYWKVNTSWNILKVKAHPLSQPIKDGSEEEFITEHHWAMLQ